MTAGIAPESDPAAAGFDPARLARILGSLGMDDTFFAVPEVKLGRLASLYSRPPIGALSLLLGAISRIAN